MPSYKYIYFNLRGRGEVVRYMFALAGVEYEDKRVEFPDWPALKADTPFGQLPVLEVDGKQIGQSITICRYLAREFNMGGKTSLDQALVDSVADQVTDLREKAVPAFMEKDEEKKKTLTEEFVGKTAPNTLGCLEKFLSGNKGGDGYFVGDTMTFADVNFFSVMELLAPLGDILKDYPKLKGLYKRVNDNDKIAAYIKDRPETTM